MQMFSWLTLSTVGGWEAPVPTSLCIVYVFPSDCTFNMVRASIKKEEGTPDVRLRPHTMLDLPWQPSLDRELDNWTGEEEMRDVVKSPPARTSQPI